MGINGKNWEARRTIKGAAIKMESEITVAENREDEKTDRVTREGGNSLTTWEIGTTFGRMHMDPGVCFHPVYANSHTQYACTINMANCRTKNTATPGTKG